VTGQKVNWISDSFSWVGEAPAESLCIRVAEESPSPSCESPLGHKDAVPYTSGSEPRPLSPVDES